MAHEQEEQAFNEASQNIVFQNTGSFIWTAPPPFEQEPNDYPDFIHNNVKNDSLALIRYNNGMYRVTKLNNYLNILEQPDVPHEYLSNTIVSDEGYVGILYEHDIDGYFHEIGEHPDNNMLISDILLNKLVSSYDLFDGEELSNIIESKLDKDEIKKEVDSTVISITPSDIELLKTNPPLFKRRKIDKISDKIETSSIQEEETFLFLSMYCPEEIPEYFTIIEKKPWSDLMVNYLNKLADLISEQMREKDEIDDIESLEVIAHKFSGYRDDIESVKLMAKEYDDYFRYCLIKDDKFLIDKNKVESLKNLSETLKNLTIVKNVSLKLNKYQKTKIKQTFVSNLIKDKKYNFKTVADIVKNDAADGFTYISIFKKLDINLSEFDKKIPEKLMNKMAVLYEYFGEKKKQSFNFIIVDKNNLCYVFEVKSATLKKWKQRLYLQGDEAYWHINNNRYDLPYKFAKEGVTI